MQHNSPSPTFGPIDSMVILGDAGVDTDEFDAHVIAHEWAHYFEDVMSRSNSEGGAHLLGESLDASLAFSEGFAEGEEVGPLVDWS